jgi:hypothetical protein
MCIFIKTYPLHKTLFRTFVVPCFAISTEGTLKFENISLALVLSNQHPPHFAITREDINSFGTPVPHRDGTSLVYIQDPSGNNVEMLKLEE